MKVKELYEFWTLPLNAGYFLEQTIDKLVITVMTEAKYQYLICVIMKAFYKFCSMPLSVDKKKGCRIYSKK